MTAPQPDHDEQRVRDLFTEALSCIGKAHAIAEQHVQTAPSDSSEARHWGYVLEACGASAEDLRAYAADVADGENTGNPAFDGGAKRYV